MRTIKAFYFGKLSLFSRIGFSFENLKSSNRASKRAKAPLFNIPLLCRTAKKFNGVSKRGVSPSFYILPPLLQRRGGLRG